MKNGNKNNQNNNGAVPTVVISSAPPKNNGVTPAETFLVKPTNANDVSLIRLMDGRRIVAVAKFFGGRLFVNGKAVSNECELTDTPTFKELVLRVMQDGICGRQSVGILWV
jgi:hypothetical protein